MVNSKVISAITGESITIPVKHRKVTKPVAFIIYAPGKVSKYHGPFFTVTEAELFAEGKLRYKQGDYEVHLLVQP